MLSRKLFFSFKEKTKRGELWSLPILFPVNILLKGMILLAETQQGEYIQYKIIETGSQNRAYWSFPLLLKQNLSSK